MIFFSLQLKIQQVLNLNEFNSELYLDPSSSSLVHHLCFCVRGGVSEHAGWTVCVHLFEARRHTPTTGLHDAIIAAHVLADLPVLFAPLLSAGQHCRVTEERRNTVTGQSVKRGSGGGGWKRERAKR